MTAATSSSDFMENLMTDLRILGRILQETAGGVRRTSWMNAVIIVTMASILSIFGTLFTFMFETQEFVKGLGSGLKISVYAKSDTDVNELQQQISALPNVKNIDVVTKDKAWLDMKQNYQVPDIPNPLPDTLHVKLSSQKYLESTATSIKEMSGVEDIYFAKNILLQLQKISRLTSIVGIAVNTFFGILTLFIISNTIHLLIQARYQEIEILRMMGVSNWYIQLPFLFQGAFYGLAGACIAYVPLSIAHHYLTSLFAYFQLTSSSYSFTLGFMILLVMGIVVGSAGALMSVHKYLKV
ncbi:MAG: permease-like cell division protein FtsX [Vampirovibrionales bacterium]|nr:permease-like cell division protein FtsX [Vampirovibrionales bacterium]